MLVGHFQVGNRSCKANLRKPIVPTVQSYHCSKITELPFFSFLQPAPVSGRVVVPVPTPPRSPTSESSLVTVVSVLGVVILLVFAPIVVIIVVLSKGRCAASKLKKELEYTRYT